MKWGEGTQKGAEGSSRFRPRPFGAPSCPFPGPSHCTFSRECHSHCLSCQQTRKRVACPETMGPSDLNHQRLGCPDRHGGAEKGAF